ncbi:ABC transporter permease [uncultured Mucilaginibacter sp.]|uniref:ABC transporter permease n=1 Tax=uncultured Mucilaginibacter sp. TaxID=797541 RepID=UPI002628EEF1|nr:ABC transporter permease [uncultured Mucilaginibacter sp.]
MIKNYFKIAWRNLIKNKVYSAINIVGLTVGMAVIMLIGFWIYDELSFNKSFDNYDHIVKFIQNSSDGKDISTYPTVSIPLVLELRNKYASDFKHLALSKSDELHILSFGDKKISKIGIYAEPEMPEILSLKMVSGELRGIQDQSTIMISESLAKIIFGNADPLNKVLLTDDKKSYKVSGIFKDFGRNTDFKGVDFLMPWSALVAEKKWIKEAYADWNDNSFLLYGELNEHSGLDEVNAKVKNIFIGKPGRNDDAKIVLQPMRNWHLYNEFRHGINTGGAIQYVWMFALIGLFVLLLACINFMNLSTARSQIRAKEVGVRKAIGSQRKQLIIQFLSESILITFIALLLALLLVKLSLPKFNMLAEKSLIIPWSNPIFWLMILSFTLFTGLISGSYPALYLSSFNTIKVLKGTFKVGRFAAVPRQVLVVFQFSISVILIIGTIVVFQQIQYAKNRPLGYDKNGLITIDMSTPNLHGKYDLLRSELLNSGASINMAEASNSATNIGSHLTGFKWKGKDPNVDKDISVSGVTHDFGKTVGWLFAAGRDFSRQYGTDTTGMIVNEAAVKHMGLKNPIGETVKFNDVPYHVIGVIKDVVMESPYEQAQPTVFFLNYEGATITIRLNPRMSTRESLAKIKAIFEKLDPAAPFDFRFVDADFAYKFAAEQRVGSLATFFAVFAVLISCLGIFGLASFIAEQRVKEIGIRKVLGASVVNLWALLSKDFLVLVSISFLIAIPASYYFMHQWLQHYEYRTEISIWVFLFTAVGAIVITLLTVSFQAIKAALANPVKSLRSE